MSRKLARETAMKALYQIDIQRDDIDDQLLRIIQDNQLDEQDKTFFLEIVNGVHDHKTELDVLIDKHSKNWDVTRMPKVDLAILRLCTYELKFREDVPAKASINEAVEMSKKYCEDKSKTFINGVLGKIVEEIEQ